MPPRRAAVSGIRRPATPVLLATTRGSVVPMPSAVERSTSSREGTSDRLGTMNTSLYVRSNGGAVSVRKRIGGPKGPIRLPGRRWSHVPPATVPTVRREPVVLVHGWGGSFATTWQAPGWEALLQDAGRTVIGVDLLGHGTAPKPHDPADYADLTTRIVDAIPADGQIDAIGFSMGAMTLLELAIRSPERFGRLVVAGIGKNIFEDDPDRRKIIIDAVEGRETDDNVGRLFAQSSQQPANAAAPLAAVMKRTGERLTKDRLAAVTCPVLVALGDKDFAGPADPLMDALPDARLVTLKGVDHFATPESFAFIDAALEFLDAVP